MSDDFFDMPEDLTASSYVDKPGFYHFTVDMIDENPTSNSGAAIDGKKLVLTVLAGTVPEQVGRRHSETIFNPNLSSRDQGKFARLKIGRLVRALRMHDTKSGKLAVECRGQSVSLNWKEAIGRQFVGCLVPNKDNAQYVEIKGAEFYDIADDEVANVPKDSAAANLMQSASGLTQQPSQSQPTQSQQPAQTQQPAATAAASQGGEWNDLLG